MTTHPVFKAGNTALITGAASGIGLAVAQLCQKHGMHLALIDNNASLLTETRASVFKDDRNVKTYPMDVSNIEEWKDLRAKVEMDFGQVGLVMLNAGIGLKSGWEDIEYFHKIFNTNLFGVINGITTFLPSLRAQPHPTALIITGSKQGLTNPPGNPAYNASKAAVRSLAESLSFDLRATPTSVHLLIPGWTYTGLTGAPGEAATARDKKKPEGAWWPEQVAGYLEEKMAEGRFYVVCPDNEVSVGMDRRRVLWGAGDVVEGRPPLSRWREKWKGEAEEWMKRAKEKEEEERNE